MTKLNITNEKVKAICNASHTAEVVITSLGMRERLRLNSDIMRLKTQLVRGGEKIVDEDYLQFWKDLEIAGIGKIALGRKGGKPVRFTWYCNLKDFAKVAIEGKNIDLQYIETKNQVKSAKSQKPLIDKPLVEKPAVLAEFKSIDVPELSVYVQFRADYGLKINLPKNVTKDELEIIGRAIKSCAS